MPYQVKSGGIIRTKSIVRPGKKIPQAKIPRPNRAPLSTRPFGNAPKKQVQTDAAADKAPAGRVWTLPEYRVFDYLIRHKKFIEGLDFEFQSSQFGGRSDLGGLVVDFLFPNHFPPGLVLNVEGEHWHRYSTVQRAKEVIDRTRLESRGFKVVFGLESHINANVGWVVDNALRGTQLFNQTV